MKSALHYPVGPSWRVLLADLGLEPSDVLRRADLAEGLLSRPGERLSPDEFYRFWEAMESLSTGHFALRFNESLRTDAFSPPVFAAMCSPNLLGAIRRLSEYKPLVAPMTIAITETPELVTFEPRWFGASRPVPSSMALGDLLFILRLARAGTRKPVTACRVWSESASEADQELASHFGTELETRVGHGIVLSRSEALRPFLTADPALWETFEPELKRRLAALENEASTTMRTAAVLLEALPSGTTALADVARRLSMSDRTLQRRLGEEGTTYRAVLDATRKDLAHSYLSRTHLAASEISFLLGFSDVTSFYRAFLRWTGSTPESFRQELGPL